jgi:FixJ family two-component response regulator
MFSRRATAIAPDQSGFAAMALYYSMACLRRRQAGRMDAHRDLARQIGVVGIVDDDPAVRNSLKFSLEIDGFAVGVFANANELLREADLQRFRCLVIDQHMPGTNGLDLVATLREQQVLVPVVLITSNPPKSLAVRARQAGVPIVEKPLLGNALIDMIRELTGAERPPRPN